MKLVDVPDQTGKVVIITGYKGLVCVFYLYIYTIFLFII